jgi:hypothetical protein
LEWHISNSYFCNGISPSGESYNGINPINPLYLSHGGMHINLSEDPLLIGPFFVGSWPGLAYTFVLRINILAGTWLHPGPLISDRLIK